MKGITLAYILLVIFAIFAFGYLLHKHSHNEGYEQGYVKGYEIGWDEKTDTIKMNNKVRIIIKFYEEDILDKFETLMVYGDSFSVLEIKNLTELLDSIYNKVERK